MRRRATLALGLVALATLSLPAARRALSQRAAAAPAAPQTRKEQARTVVVREIDFEGLKGLLRRGGDDRQARPLLVNFWATWCEPCREEFPDLVEIDRDYRARGLEFVTVSIDDPAEIKTSVPAFLRSMKAAMPAYLLNVPDPEPVIKSVDAEWGGALPATFLFDAQGRVVFKKVGRVKPADLRAALEDTLGAGR